MGSVTSLSFKTIIFLYPNYFLCYKMMFKRRSRGPCKGGVNLFWHFDNPMMTLRNTELLAWKATSKADYKEYWVLINFHFTSLQIVTIQCKISLVKFKYSMFQEDRYINIHVHWALIFIELNLYNFTIRNIIYPFIDSKFV